MFPCDRPSAPTMLKLHLFFGFTNAALRITPDTKLGHLYHFRNDPSALKDEARQVGMMDIWLQCSDGFWHFDLWGRPLRKAKALFPVVSDAELANDLAEFSRPLLLKGGSD